MSEKLDAQLVSNVVTKAAANLGRKYQMTAAEFDLWMELVVGLSNGTLQVVRASPPQSGGGR